MPNTTSPSDFGWFDIVERLPADLTLNNLARETKPSHRACARSAVKPFSTETLS